MTGGAGFVGSHLCRNLLREGWHVHCIDSLMTGSLDNIQDLLGESRFRFELRDLLEGLDKSTEVDFVLHLASPASPPVYLQNPIHTLEVGAFGTRLALQLAMEQEASFLLASTSEVYGDPQVHPQPETYWGNVDPIGPRSVYDESKRYAEALSMAFHRAHGLDIRIVRIFNTYGPNMRRDDGRAVPSFVAQALAGEPLTVHGDGTQTRSLCYIDDLIEGLRRAMESEHPEPVNLGNPEEIRIGDLAQLVKELVGSPSEIVFVPRPEGDPEIRCPDIELARSRLKWEPLIPLREGLARTIDWAREAGTPPATSWARAPS